MKAEDQKIMHSIIDRMMELKLNRDSLAALMQVEKSTIDKQFTKLNGELTLATAYRYAEALNSAIVLLSDEDLELLREAERIRNENEKLSQQLSDLLSEKDSMRKQIENYNSSLTRLKEQNTDFQHHLEEKDRTINRLLEKYVFT